MGENDTQCFQLETWFLSLLRHYAPAGATGGEGSSWWLLLAPISMLLRWVGHLRPLTAVRRGFAVVGGAAALAAMVASSSGTLTTALGNLRGGGGAAMWLAPVAFLLTFLCYLAPAALLPGRVLAGGGFYTIHVV